ncbi:hypothetical protein ACFOY8_16280 [Thalassospira xianhensis]|uniref:hypothetical protein n=1 Tax=Thalassospira xianhensis TaxID=478503 RepID=UPI000DED9A65|nr:hypothetical protein [Thalassospira xianhensis]
MSVRTISNVYRFKNPFNLTGRAQSLPAGTYCVETYEELAEGDHFVTYQPVLSLLHINGALGSANARVSIQVSLEELDLALVMDEIAEEELALINADISEQELNLLSEIRRAGRGASVKSPFATVMR